MTAQTRDELRKLIDRLPDEYVPAVFAFAQLVQSGLVQIHVAPSTTVTDDGDTKGPAFSEEEMADDPMLRVLATAPEDDEPLSDDEAASIAEGIAEYQRGDYVHSSFAKQVHLK